MKKLLFINMKVKFGKIIEESFRGHCARPY